MNISPEEMPREIARLEDENERLQERINKAIQIIDLTFSIGVKDYKGQLEVIKNILKGSDKE